MIRWFVRADGTKVLQTLMSDHAGVPFVVGAWRDVPAYAEAENEVHEVLEDCRHEWDYLFGGIAICVFCNARDDIRDKEYPPVETR